MIPPRRRSCHLIILIRLYSPTLSLIKFVFEKVVLLFWLLIFLQFYSRSLDLLKVTWEVLRHGFWHRAHRNNSSAKNFLWRLTDHDQLRVYMIRILVFSQALNVDKYYPSHSTNWFISNPKENLKFVMGLIIVSTPKLMDVVKFAMQFLMNIYIYKCIYNHPLDNHGFSLSMYIIYIYIMCRIRFHKMTVSSNVTYRYFKKNFTMYIIQHFMLY